MDSKPSKIVVRFWYFWNIYIFWYLDLNWKWRTEESGYGRTLNWWGPGIWTPASANYLSRLRFPFAVESIVLFWPESTNLQNSQNDHYNQLRRSQVINQLAHLHTDLFPIQSKQRAQRHLWASPTGWNELNFLLHSTLRDRWRVKEFLAIFFRFLRSLFQRQQPFENEKSYSETPSLNGYKNANNYSKILN